MHKERKSPSSDISSGSSSSRHLSIARTAPESESVFSASRGRYTTMRGRDRAFGGGGIGAGDNGTGLNLHHNHQHQHHRQTSPDELYEIASVFKPVPGYERPWEMAPPRYWGQLRRLFLEESMKSSNHKDKETALGSGSKSSSLLAGTNSSPGAIATTATNELDSTSGASSSSGSLGSFSLSRGSTSVHASGSMMGGPGSDAPMSPLWEAGPPPKHWPCLYNMKHQVDDNHNHHHTHNQASKLHNVIPSSRITFDQSNLNRDRPI